MTFVAEPIRADCCCTFEEVATEGRAITVQARCDGCPQHGRLRLRQPKTELRRETEEER